MDISVIDRVGSVGACYDEHTGKESPYLLVDFGGHYRTLNSRFAVHNAVTLDAFKKEDGNRHYCVTVGDFSVNEKEAFLFSTDVSEIEHEEFQRALLETGGSWYLITISCGEREHRLIDKHGCVVARGGDDGEVMTFFQENITL